jgi:hypothetical protein
MKTQHARGCNSRNTTSGCNSRNTTRVVTHERLHGAVTNEILPGALTHKGLKGLQLAKNEYKGTTGLNRIFYSQLFIFQVFTK